MFTLLIKILLKSMLKMYWKCWRFEYVENLDINQNKVYTCKDNVERQKQAIPLIIKNGETWYNEVVTNLSPLIWNITSKRFIIQTVCSFLELKKLNKHEKACKGNFVKLYYFLKKTIYWNNIKVQNWSNYLLQCMLIPKRFL